MGQGLACPPPPPSPWRRGATEGLGARGQVTSLLALPCAKTGAWLPPLVRRGWIRRLFAACAGTMIGLCPPSYWVRAGLPPALSRPRPPARR